ncbi:MAG: hypothetical protein HWE18_10960 [Gammaproteobacteria bacterium]|nr:hypothetical protein [Gammaproteobacteria bacterium]
MIEITSGHFGCGQWQFKIIDNIPVLSHFQAFNRFDAYCIGPDEVMDYEIQASTDEKTTVKIQFTHDRYCIAKLKTQDLERLEAMKQLWTPAPTAKQSHHSVLYSLFIFATVSLLLIYFAK